MNIYVAGIYRSGSTWLFNAVRLIAIESGKTVSSGFIWSEIDSNAEIKVIKTHFFYDDFELPFEPDLIVTSVRPKDEIETSMIKQRVKGLEPQFANAGAFEDIEEFFNWLNRWRDHSKHVYEMIYADLEQNKCSKIVRELCYSLNIELTFAQIESVCNKLSNLQPPKEGFDSVTLLTPTHLK